MGLSDAPAAAHLANTALPPLGLRLLSPAGSPQRLHCSQAGGPAPRVDAGPSSAPTALSTQLSGVQGRCERLSPAPAVCPRSRDSLCAHVPPSPSHLRAGRLLQPPTGLCYVDVSVAAHGVYNAIFSFFSSFAAMDGVPFMISEKFSCVPENVSFMRDFLSLPPPLPGGPRTSGSVGITSAGTSFPA